MLQHILLDFLIGRFAFRRGQVQLVHVQFNLDMLLGIKFGQKTYCFYVPGDNSMDVKRCRKRIDIQLLSGTCRLLINQIHHLNHCIIFLSSLNLAILSVTLPTLKLIQLIPQALIQILLYYNLQDLLYLRMRRSHIHRHR